MDRRGFLKGFAGGAVGWVAAGVATHGGDLAAVYQNPVPFISAADAAGLVGGVDPDATARLQATTYPQSVAAGDPNPHGAIIWTRVAPAALSGAGPQSLTWQVATASDFATGSIVLQGLATIQASRDNTVKLPIQNPALQPFTVYYYRFVLHGVASRTGRFKTLPLPGDTVTQVRLGLVNCQDYSNGYYHAYGFLAQEEVDFMVFLGDYIYEYLDDGTGGPGGGPVRVVPPYPLGGKYPQGLADYRHLYQTYRADPEMQAAHERFAMIMLWDDHEYFNDCHQLYHEDTNPPGLSATTPQPALRQAANQAWGEYGLADIRFDASKDPLNSIKLYRTFRFGDLMDLVVTDERLYRDGPPCGDIEIGQRYQTPGCTNRTSPIRTMLGQTQKSWFLNQVTGSSAIWKVWANEVMLAQYLLPKAFTGGAPVPVFFDLDQWDGYPAERADLFTKIRDAGVDNFVAISGDAHLFMAGYLKTDYNDTAAAPIGVEFLVGAVSSGNYLDAKVEPPTTGLTSIPPGAATAAAAKLPMDAVSGLVLAANPHMQFWNGATWGYAVLTLTPTQLTCDFRVPSTVKLPTSTLQELATFTVPAGTVRIDHG